MMTTYEERFIDERISYDNLINYSCVENELLQSVTEDIMSDINIHNPASDYFDMKTLFSVLQDKTDKSILELCFEIKPITVERLNAISIEQLLKFAKNNNIEIVKKLLVDTEEIINIFFNNEYGYLLIASEYQGKTRVKLKRVEDLLKYKGIAYNKYSFDSLRAIHDLVSELETI